MNISSFARNSRRLVGCALFAALCLSTPIISSARPREQVRDGAYARYVLERLVQAAGFGERIRLARGPVDYAQALVVDDADTILYNAKALEQLEKTTGSAWSAVSVIAHELGHHYYDHARRGRLGVEPEAILQCELDADYFSGYALALLGASLDEAQVAQRSLNAEESLYHPGAPARLRAIKCGWLDGRAGLSIAPEPRLVMAAPVPEPTSSAWAAPRAVRVAAPLSLEVGRW